jgi:hypothetical protein
MTQETKQPNWSAAFNNAAFDGMFSMWFLGLTGASLMSSMPAISALPIFMAIAPTVRAYKYFKRGLNEPISQPVANKDPGMTP